MDAGKKEEILWTHLPKLKQNDERFNQKILAEHGHQNNNKHGRHEKDHGVQKIFSRVVTLYFNSLLLKVLSFVICIL